MVLLLLDGFSTGSAAYMMLPLSFASYMLKCKVDNIRSSVKAVRMFGELLVERATVYAALETSDKAMSLGDFEVDFQELFAHYLASNSTITYTGQVTVSYKSMSKKESFKIVQDFSSTAEVQFVVSETSLEGLLSFLQLPKSLVSIDVPLVGTLDSFASGLDSIGFILKQDIYDSSGLYLKSVFFEVSQDSLVQFLPTAVRPAHIAVKVSIFNPRDTTCRIGVEANFPTDVKNYQLQCKFLILPVPNDNEQRNTGYICTCTLSTSGVNYNTDSSGLDSLMAALGLENTTKAISSSLPVIGSLLNSIVLKQVTLTYHSGEVSNVDTLYIGLMVTKWSLFNSISLNGFDIQIQFSKACGWSAYIEGKVNFGKEYLVSVEFTLPTDTTAGSLYFQNHYEDFTVGKLVTYLGLPALSDVPVLGSILDITIKTATLGLETGESGKLSLQNGVVHWLC